MGCWWWQVVFACVAAALVWSGAASAALAVEYRLRVVSVFEDAFSACLSWREFADGASGPGLDRLEQMLDVGQFPAGAILYDRPLQVPDAWTAEAFGALPVRAEVVWPSRRDVLWNEVRWDGKPGDLALWVIGSTSLHAQELVRAAVKGAGPMRQYLAYATPGGDRLVVVKYPQLLLAASDGRPTRKVHLARTLNLDYGIGVVVGSEDNLLFADRAYVVTRQGEVPTTFKAVLVWRRRLPADLGNRESPGGNGSR